ncbi:hypothetical protein DFR40_1820 [Azonexus fungiphilus]|uniref:Uncharacterized protein n=1 Tax=Azonexus fungiphilus TaxID=146940 RepID=A0A495WAU7_9RHOO|nr:hypothetical protein [Azonexus fungiphilus]RKT58792.1 hypothetical protein DFR40_1820 [Azonexus fungiphilus]
MLFMNALDEGLGSSSNGKKVRSMDCSNEKSEVRFRNALAALRGVIETDIGDDAETSVEMFRKALLTAEIRAAMQLDVHTKGSWSSIRRLFREARAVDAVIACLEKTGRFDNKQILRIRRVKLFKETSAGEIVIRPQPIREPVATSWVSLLSMFVGGWVSWVWFAAEGTPNLIVSSFVLGTTLGALAGKVLDYSFRFAAIRKQVLEVAPWMKEGVCLKLSCR